MKRLMLPITLLLMFSCNSYEFDFVKPEKVPDKTIGDVTRTTEYIESVDGSMLEAWFYKSPVKNSPIIIMAPGMISTKEDLLENFAWDFSKNGYNVLLFDFRTFGGSEGMPRHWLDMGRHIEDYNSVVEYVYSIMYKEHNIDRSKIVLWGSSYSGGSSLYATSQNTKVKAAIAQVPFLRVPDELKPGFFDMPYYIFKVIQDMMGSKPSYIQCFGRPDESVFSPSKYVPPKDNMLDFSNEDVSQFFKEIPTPEQHRGGWDNVFLARYLDVIDNFDPLSIVSDITVPIFFAGCTEDDLTLDAYIQEAYSISKNPLTEYHQFEDEHFNIYLGETYKKNIKLQLEFLNKVLF